MSLTDRQVINLRRKLEEFLRHTAPQNITLLVKYANKIMEAKIKIPKNLIEKHLSKKK